MSCGCECLVSDIDENKSVVCDYGTTFRHGDVKDLKDKLTEILSQPERDMSGQREHIKENYSWDAVTRETLKIYEKR